MGVTIPVTVWPSIGHLLTWWLLVFLGLLGLRWQSVVSESKSYGSIFSQIGDDLTFAAGIFLLGAPVLAVLQLLGLLATMRPPEDS